MIYRMEHSGRRYNRQQCIGEMVELPGVHIVRSTGRKDRHSKVHTSRGLRDRRVRLSAHTAIQFYDVQDRLGYDRPSKAVDWLIQNARDAIDQLEDNHAPADRCTAHDQTMQAVTTVHNSIMQPVSDAIKSSSFFPAPLSSNVINKPFSTATAAASYHNYTPDLLLHTSSRSQDLHLSLQSFHQPIIQDHSHQNPSYTLQSFCSAYGATAVTCPEINERMNAPANSCDGGGEFLHNVVPPSQFQLCAQREPLHSSNLPSLRAWANSTASSPSWMFTSENYGGFSGFHIPAWIQGEEEHHGIANNQHSASSASHQWSKWKE